MLKRVVDLSDYELRLNERGWRFRMAGPVGGNAGILEKPDDLIPPSEG